MTMERQAVHARAGPA